MFIPNKICFCFITVQTKISTQLCCRWLFRVFNVDMLRVKCRGRGLEMNLRVTRSKVLLSSGSGRTWQVSRFNLAGGRLIWRQTNTPMSACVGKKIGHYSTDRCSVAVVMCPHRTVWNGQAAKFDTTLSLLPHFPDPAGWSVKTKNVEHKKEHKCILYI